MTGPNIIAAFKGPSKPKLKSRLLSVLTGLVGLIFLVGAISDFSIDDDGGSTWIGCMALTSVRALSECSALSRQLSL